MYTNVVFHKKCFPDKLKKDREKRAEAAKKAMEAKKAKEAAAKAAATKTGKED